MVDSLVNHRVQDKAVHKIGNCQKNNARPEPGKSLLLAPAEEIAAGQKHGKHDP